MLLIFLPSPGMSSIVQRPTVGALPRPTTGTAQRPDTGAVRQATAAAKGATT